MMLTVLDRLPRGILSLTSRELYRVLPGPTLIHMQGEIAEPLFVSVLIHGNEESGWEAIKKLLVNYTGNELPRSLSLFIGNIEAARYGKRFLPGQQDYNRVWKDGHTPEHKMMQKIIREMRARNIFMSIDVHNTSGRNPHYACINRTQSPFPGIAGMFSNTVVYFLKPDTVQSMAFSEICPSVTIECGPSGETSGINRASDFIHRCLLLRDFREVESTEEKLEIFHTVAVVKIPEQYSFGFGDRDCDIDLDHNFEMFNFRELPAGEVIGRVMDGIARPFDVRDEQSREVSENYFHISDHEIQVKRDVVPAMITLNREIIRQDCLCYLMERYPLD